MLDDLGNLIDVILSSLEIQFFEIFILFINLVCIGLIDITNQLGILVSKISQLIQYDLRLVVLIKLLHLRDTLCFVQVGLEFDQAVEALGLDVDTIGQVLGFNNFDSLLYYNFNLFQLT